MMMTQTPDMDPLYTQAVHLVIGEQRCSTSHIQNRLSIGYNKAARLVERMEEDGIVTTADHVGRRDVVAAELPEAFAQEIDSRRLSGSGLPMKETAADRDVTNTTFRVAAGELRQFIERFERLELEKKEITDQQKEVMASAKARGYDTKAMRRIIALRKKSSDEIAEEEAILDMYKDALGMR